MSEEKIKETLRIVAGKKYDEFKDSLDKMEYVKLDKERYVDLVIEIFTYISEYEISDPQEGAKRIGRLIDTKAAGIK